MIASLSFELAGEAESKSVLQKAPLFHGYLMEHIDPAYAETLHQNGLKPYSQTLSLDGGKLIWTLHALNKTAYENILLPLSEPSITGTGIEIKHNNLTLDIKSRTIKETDYTQLIEDYYLGNCSRYVSVQFYTPAAFKQEGRYIFFPDLRLIYQSLMMRFDAFAEKQSIYLEETLEELADYTEITRYNLHSVGYPLEGIRVPAFAGSIQVKINGPMPLVNLANMMLHYGEYAGVGIKTALGMGGLRLVEGRPR